MDRIFEANTSETPPDPPDPGATGYPVPRDPGVALPTIIGAYWHHMITESLLAILTRASVTPDHEDFDLLADAIEVLAAAPNFATQAVALTWDVGYTGSLNLWRLGTLVFGLGSIALDGTMIDRGIGTVPAGWRPSAGIPTFPVMCNATSENSIFSGAVSIAASTGSMTLQNNNGTDDIYTFFTFWEITP